MRDRTLWFVVPANGRHEIAEVCFRQLRRTCDALAGRGILASAVVIADDENLELARAQGFATVERDNEQLGRKINDGYQLAGQEGVEFMVPLGNDDWINPDWIRLPRGNEIIVTHKSSVVREDGRRLARLHIGFGDGVRVYPRRLLQRVGFRPAAEDRSRAIDAATHSGLRGARPVHVWHDRDALDIVDFKSAEQLNDYRGCLKFREGHESSDPWGDLAAIYPAEAISEMQAVFGLVSA